MSALLAQAAVFLNSELPKLTGLAKMRSLVIIWGNEQARPPNI
jgi:hypothetical protein